MAQDYLMWVGKWAYPTPEDFIAEASVMGASKRVAMIPGELELGKSRVWLVHDTARTGRDPVTKLVRKNTGKIFGFFVASHVDYVVDDIEMVKTVAEKHKGLPIRQITSKMLEQEDVRGCGYRREGLYLVGEYSETDMAYLIEAAKGLTDKADIRGGLVVLRQYVDYHYENRKFRGFKKFDATTIFPNIGIEIPNIEKIVETPSVTIREKVAPKRDAKGHFIKA